jgi:hypothetical protein
MKIWGRILSYIPLFEFPYVVLGLANVLEKLLCLCYIGEVYDKIISTGHDLAIWIIYLVGTAGEFLNVIDMINCVEYQ